MVANVSEMGKVNDIVLVPIHVYWFCYLSVSTHTHTNTHTHTCACIHTCVCTHTHTHTYAVSLTASHKRYFLQISSCFSLIYANFIQKKVEPYWCETVGKSRALGDFIVKAEELESSADYDTRIMTLKKEVTIVV